MHACMGGHALTDSDVLVSVSFDVCFTARNIHSVTLFTLVKSLVIVKALYFKVTLIFTLTAKLSLNFLFL